jgi:hypothetical protein
MASTATNRLAKTLADRLISGKSYKMMLLTGVSTSWQTAATARDFNVVSDIVADEASHASYARQNVTLATSEDDTGDQGEIHYSDVTFPVLAAAVGEVKGVVIYEVVTADSDHIIVAIHDTDAVLNNTPDGNDFIVKDGADGAIHLETT